MYELKMYEIKALIFMDAELNLISVIYSIFQVHNNASQPSQRASHNLVSLRQCDEQKQTNKQTNRHNQLQYELLKIPVRP